jgi:2-dehydro-3-deoxyphosphogluconate aldolase/(4S)-4-hydroxy-2-oxoglutarate aldolase
MEVLNAVMDAGLVPLFYNGDIETAKEIASACMKGGAKVVEFTNRGELAYPVFTELAKHLAKADVILGVGSIQDAPTAALYLASGANFVVSPSFNPEVARLCNRRKIPYLPGCATETEIATAEESGVEICKMFPGEAVGGPSFVSAVMAPCPWHRLLPTGGVDATEESISAWIKAGAAAVGMGSKLITAQAVKDRNYDAITDKVAQCIGLIQKARGVPLFTGIEHPGLYPHQATAAEISAWYANTFGLKSAEGNSSFFISGVGPGRLEVMKTPEDVHCHVAVRVSNFEAAVEALKAKGVALKEANVKPEIKAVYLQDPDPDGNPVHLVWKR